MTVRSARFALWVTFFCTVPVPYYMVEVGFAPTLRVGLLAGLTSALYVSDPDATALTLAAVTLVQLSAYTWLWYGVGTFAARRLPEPRRGLGVAIVCVVLASLSLLELYTTPLSAEQRHTNLLGVFD
ncbi:MAG: hypothetical protein MJE66_21925 [Proteobacteria bacterium]|nr:hypothetical protein [Pseudomonadota bacterium]